MSRSRRGHSSGYASLGGLVGLKTTGGRFLRFGPKKPVGISAGMGGGTWRHREACVEAKQSREEPMAIGWTDLKLDHYAPGVKWFS